MFGGFFFCDLEERFKIFDCQFLLMDSWFFVLMFFEDNDFRLGFVVQLCICVLQFGMVVENYVKVNSY